MGLGEGVGRGGGSSVGVSVSRSAENSRTVRAVEREMTGRSKGSKRTRSRGDEVPGRDGKADPDGGVVGVYKEGLRSGNKLGRLGEGFYLEEMNDCPIRVERGSRRRDGEDRGSRGPGGGGEAI